MILSHSQKSKTYKNLFHHYKNQKEFLNSNLLYKITAKYKVHTKDEIKLNTYGAGIVVPLLVKLLPSTPASQLSAG